MKIDSFLNVLRTKKNENDRADYIKSAVKNKYVPLEEKQARAKNIIKSSFYEKDGETERFHVNSVAKYMLTCITLVEMYTNLERSVKMTVLDEFNKLNEAGVFDILVQSIDQRELKEFNMVLDMETNDIMTNEYEPGAFVRN